MEIIRDRVGYDEAREAFALLRGMPVTKSVPYKFFGEVVLTTTNIWDALRALRNGLGAEVGNHLEKLLIDDEMITRRDALAAVKDARRIS